MINTLDEINAASVNPVKFIEDCTNQYLEPIKKLAKEISENENIKIVSIAGPSASGKTTTAHILMQELENLGEKTAVLSLDDFYKKHENIPTNPDGTLDFETVDALDTEYIKKCFNEIIESGQTLLPIYDFKVQNRAKETKPVEVGKKGIIICEGLHALNTAVTSLVPRKSIFKIYISVNHSVENADGIQLFSSRQVRLIRRILRDERFRGNSVKETLFAWDAVTKGDSKYLYPFTDTADAKLSTLHPFELCVYRERFCALRNQVDRNTPWYEYFNKTVNALELFENIDENFVPENSLIREFIG